MIKTILSVLFVICLIPKGYSQDTIQIQNVNQFKLTEEQAKRMRSYTTTVEQISIRVGGGVQKNGYLELGGTWYTCTYGCTGYFSEVFYSSLEWTPAQKDIYGIKAGYEVSFFLLALGIETKYQTNFNKGDFVITPKIGLGMYGIVNIYYGYNISMNKTPFTKIGHHQFSIVLNIAGTL